MTEVATLAPTTGHNSATFAETLEKDPSIIFTDPKALPALLSYFDNEIAAHVPDLSSKKGREAITKLTSRIVSQKTSLDALGKEMNEEARASIDAVDQVRRKLRTDLDALRDRARKPLTDWEAAEDDKKAKINHIRLAIANAAQIPHGATVAQIDRVRAEISGLVIQDDLFGELAAPTESERGAVLVALDEAKVRIEKDEADRAELARLREVEQARVRAAEEAATAEAAAQAERDRIVAAETRAAEAERLRIQEANAAAERARDAESAEQARKAQAAIDEANRKARDAEEALAKERREEAERVAAAQAARDTEAAAEAARQSDIAHRSEVMRAAKEAIMEHAGLGEATAKKIVLAIGAGSIPNVTLRF